MSGNGRRRTSRRCRPPNAGDCRLTRSPNLGDRLYQFWLRFCGGFTTRTRDTSAHAYAYLRAQLTMDTERNFANMDRTLHGGDGQALQKPWTL